MTKATYMRFGNKAQVTNGESQMTSGLHIYWLLSQLSFWQSLDNLEMGQTLTAPVPRSACYPGGRSWDYWQAFDKAQEESTK